MKGNKKLRLVILLSVMAVIVIACIAKTISGNKEETEITASFDESGAKVITSSKLAETKEYAGLQISDVNIKFQDNMTIIEANAKNNTSKDMEGQWVNINVLDKDGNTISTIGGYIDPVKAGETTPISSSIVSNGEDKRAYDIKVTERTEEKMSGKIVTPDGKELDVNELSGAVTNTTTNTTSNVTSQNNVTKNEN